MQKAGFNDTKSITFGADTVGVGSTSAVSQQSQGSVSTMQRSAVSRAKDITFGADSGAQKPPAPPPRKWGSNQPTQSRQRAISNTKPSQPPKQPTAGKGMARGGGYGLDAELAKKMALKYDVGMEREAAAWIESVTGSDMSGDFAGLLKDGQILCALINEIRPGAIRKIGASKMPFKQMENVSNFLKACRGLGVAEHDLFETVDLYEEKVRH
jgi:hypothetical protein